MAPSATQEKALREISGPALDDSIELKVGEGSSYIYLLRTMQQHHVQLSAMADQKASFLIGSSFVMLTLLIGQFNSGNISFAITALAVTTMLAALFAVLAVLPRNTKAAPPSSKNFNPLFFGSFAGLSADEYAAEMERVMASDESVYHAMLMDIYQMGKVLHDKKYRYLRYSYRIFLVGLTVSFLGAIVEAVVTLPA